MGSYYAHTRREHVEVHYSFQCEHCGMDSGILSTAIYGPEAETPSHSKTISSAQEEKLGQRAHKFLVRELKKIHKEAVEKKIFSDVFNDQCPHCNKPQSWAVARMKKDRFDDSFTALGLGVFISGFVVVAHFIGGQEYQEYLPLPLAAVIFALSVPIAIVLYVRRMAKINKKIESTSSGTKNLPVIYWEGVQALLNEPD
ncbi:MAG: hypothetical protein NC417_11390 [Candidatus Gastranaerophilales bacterium]|nr:hypothetical protein [Candidatus Gastranaerophilales bacterium]